MAKSREDIVSRSFHDNETWNDCPKCGAEWKDTVPTPGVIHRTRLCQRCKEKLRDISS